jgi:hypothetical protein
VSSLGSPSPLSATPVFGNGMWKVRFACLAYLAFLTLVSLGPGPAVLSGLWRLVEARGMVGVHFVAFAVLGVLVAGVLGVGSRFPRRRALLIGLLLVYAVGVELLQVFVPSRTLEAGDVMENLLGLLAGMAIWKFAAEYKTFAGRDVMPKIERFRIVTPEEHISPETYVLAEEQPETIKANCVLLVDQANDRRITVHGTRLVPADDPLAADLDHKHTSACMKCGHVEGIVEDQVTCPNNNLDCGLLEAER